jgi:hypothetical protein
MHESLLKESNLADNNNQCLHSRSDETLLHCNNQHCNASTTVLSVVTEIKDFTLYVPVKETEFGVHPHLQTLIYAHRNLQSFHGHGRGCPTCGHVDNTLSRRCLTAPILLNVIIGQEYLTLDHLDLLVINPIIDFDNIQYSISTVIYGDGNHFITRFVFDGCAYHGDGMRKETIQGKTYQRTHCILLPSEKPFPGHILDTTYCVSQVEYIRTDSLA